MTEQNAQKKKEICFWRVIARIEQDRITLTSKRGFATYVPKDKEHVDVKTDKVNDCYSCLGNPCEDYFAVPLEMIVEHLRHGLQQEFTNGKLEITQGPETNRAYSYASNTLNDFAKCEILQIPKRLDRKRYHLIAQFYDKHPEAYKILELLIENS